MNTITLPQLTGLVVQRPVRAVRNWFLHRLENHYLICADAEAKAVKDAAANLKYYQERAAFVRSARVSQ